MVRDETNQRNREMAKTMKTTAQQKGADRESTNW